MQVTQREILRALAISVAFILPLTLTNAANAGPYNPYVTEIVRAVQGPNVNRHQQALQRIANIHGGTRVIGSPGFDASRDYMADKLKKAGYRVTFTDVQFPVNWRQLSPPVLEQVAPDARTYAERTDFFTFLHSGSGDVTAQVQGVDLMLPPGAPNTSTSGCQAGDFNGFVPGRLALMQRGSCAFEDKASNAKRAGASAAIIFNEGQPGRTDALERDIGEWRLGFPVISTSFAVGADLADPAGTMVRVKTDTSVEVKISNNVIAETPGGSADTVVMAGAHLDSVAAGPGINDNGSGAAALLETALQMRDFPVRNKVRFAFWTGEERALFGSRQYVAGLPPAELDKIRLYLNFDMISSPNFAYKVFDGDGSDGPGSPPGPPGSDKIEDLFERFYADRGLGHVGTPFNGLSDYEPFFVKGIATGGLFTGSDATKTTAEAALFGGQAGQPYDPCYHQACDTVLNVNHTALDVNADGVATAVVTYAFDSDPIPPRGIRSPSLASSSTIKTAHS